MTYREEAEKRGCYCGSWDDETPQRFFVDNGLPKGFCGKCERCGANGHIRHFPGPLPYTGAWCDHCYRVLAWTWPLRLPVIWLLLVIAATVAVIRFVG